MTQASFVICIVVWLVLAGARRGVKGVPQRDSHRDVKGRTRTGATNTHSRHPSMQPLQDPESLEPTELPPVNTYNTSYTPQGSYSKPYKLVEVLNTSMSNTSLINSSSPTPSTSQDIYKGSRFDASLSYPARPRQPHKAIDSNTNASYPAGPSRAPTLQERVAARQLLAPKKNYTPVIASLINEYTLPNWERPPTNLTTHGSYSRVYHLPSWESSLSLFGVQADSEVRINLLHADRNEAPVNITLYGHEDESEINFNQSGSGHVVVSRHKLTLDDDYYTWFTIFRKGHLVYVFLANKLDPFLVYEHGDKKLQLLRYTRFQVWSKKRADWDLVGRKYKDENKCTSPPEKALTEELAGIKEGLAERFGLITNLVSVLQRPDLVNNLSLPDIQEIKDVGESVIPLRNILYYYCLTDDKKMHWTST